MRGIFYRTLVINMSVPCMVNGKCTAAHSPTGQEGAWACIATRFWHTFDGGLRLCALSIFAGFSTKLKSCNYDEQRR